MLFGIVFSSITFISFTETLTKREAANLKFSTPAVITSSEVIIARYDAIIDHSERAHSYNHRSNYANYRYWLTTSIQAAVITFYTMMMGERGGGVCPHNQRIVLWKGKLQLSRFVQQKVQQYVYNVLK